MAKKKRRRRLEYVDYEHAMRDVEKLTSEDKVDSEEYEAAIEAATQFFLRDRGKRFFNVDQDEVDTSVSCGELHKWFTVNDLLKLMRVSTKA